MIEERIELPTDSAPLNAAAVAAEHLAGALDDVKASAINASKATAGVQMVKGAVPGAKAQAPSGAKAPAASGWTDDHALRVPQASKAQAPSGAKAPAVDTKASDNALKKGLEKTKKAAAQKAKLEGKAAKESGALQKKMGAALGVVKAFGVGAALAVAAKGLEKIRDGLEKIGETKIARDNIKAMLNQLTRGRGEQTFAKLNALAHSLGSTIEDVSGDFYALRKKGLNNVDSINIIKLKKDLEAVGVQAPEVAGAIDKVSAAVLAGGKSGDVIAQVAKQFGAVGDGSNAAAKSAQSVEGAFNTLGTMFNDALAGLGDEFGPDIIELVHTIQDAFNSLDPNTAADFTASIHAGFKLLKPVIRGVVAAIGFFMDVFTSVANLLSGKGVLFNDLAEVVHSLQESFQSAKTKVVSFYVAIQAGIATAVDIVMTGINTIIDTIRGFYDRFVALGRSLIDGIAEGIEAAIPGLAKPSAKAARTVEEAVRKASETQSPSKVMRVVGDDMVAGLKKPFTDLRSADIMARTFFDDLRLSPPANDGASSAPVQGTREVNVHVEITINGRATQGDLDELEERVESAVRRAVG